jgi:hypothetical protein
MTRKLFLLPVLAVIAFPATAREYSPRVISPHNADAYSMKTFRQYHRWKGLDGDQLAWEVYKYLVDRRTGVFHMNQVLEGRDVLSEYRTVRDPVKILNVYGYGYCGIFGPLMAGIWQDMGLGPARTLVLPAWNHVTTEVYYDGGWHYVDLDVRAVFRRDDGTLASMAAAREDASLWKDRGPLFFPNDSLESTRAIYQRTPVHHYHGFNQSGHTMDFVLRQGESLTRWWKPQGGRWHHAREYDQVPWLRKLIEEEPPGPKPNHRHFTVHNYANGRFVYEPDLTDESSDFEDGAYDSENVRPGPEGLALASPGEGYAIFEVRTPYVIVPVVGRLETTGDDREASVCEIDGRGAGLAISLDNALTWQDVNVASWPATVDLTRYVGGTYGYLLKITLRGRPDEAVVRSLRQTTWVQAAPAALPSLRQGTNKMQYLSGDHYGLDTRVVEVRSNASDPADLAKYLVEPPEDYDPDRKTHRIRGPLVAKVAAPPRTRIAWFCAGASFRTHLHQAARHTRNGIAYAVDEAGDFQEIYGADVPQDTEHWHYNASREVRLREPARRVFVRYVGDPAINNFQIYAHCQDDGRPSAMPVAITHAWTEAGRRKVKTIRPQPSGSYEIVVDREPVNEMIQIAVPSDGRSRLEARKDEKVGRVEVSPDDSRRVGQGRASCWWVAR